MFRPVTLNVSTGPEGKVARAGFSGDERVADCIYQHALISRFPLRPNDAWQITYELDRPD